MNVVNALLGRRDTPDYDSNPVAIPPEILVKIFSYISMNECIHVQRSCWIFRRVVDCCILGRARFFGFNSSVGSQKFLQTIAKMITFLKVKTCLYSDLQLIKGREKTVASYHFFTKNLLQFDFDLAIDRLQTKMSTRTFLSLYSKYHQHEMGTLMKVILATHTYKHWSVDPLRLEAPLYDALEIGDYVGLRLLTRLLRSWPDYLNRFFRELLCHATFNGLEETLDFCIAERKESNLRDEPFVEALKMASYKGNKVFVRKLIEAGVDPDGTHSLDIKGSEVDRWAEKIFWERSGYPNMYLMSTTF